MTPAQIKKIRLALNMTQAQFGEWLGGYGRTSVYHWEAGRKKPGFAVEGLIKERAKTDNIIRKAMV